ncbi:acyltransferase [Flavobacterium album]|uniref:Acyltransferase n=1 Tax=Flavobacterium album TaxID=2175091 RepID=A0A2S1R1X8_9FLAO|nr:acyltransferase [Flavobacterium album]AWH86678.1 acyltransferase [Flavobacterium album]
MQAAPLQSKPHYAILDGLRGVAALIVVAFHIFETHATSHLDQVINHGYLAVDFFFLLSGFVVGYAYDDRWGKMTLGGFFKRRLIRLQPMVIMGMVIGAIGFYFQDSAIFPGISEIPLWQMLLIMLIGCTMLPVPPSMDLRGWGEMHPLNGPAWSLFYEYIANILYALIVKNFSKMALSVLVFLSAFGLVHMAVTGTNGDVVGGWSLNAAQLHVGFARLMYPFFAGLLLQRVVKPGRINNAFLWSSLLVIAVLAMPRVGGSEHLWANGLYDSLSIIFIFPLIVYIGASGGLKGKNESRVNKFLGDISYPIYITHYPLIYIYTGWISDTRKPISEAWPVSLLLFVSAIVLAYVCLKLYDEPVRKWLSGKFLR